MTEKEYKATLKELEKRYDDEKIKLIKKYCLSNNTYKIGDKFTDHIGSIIIDKIDFYLYTSNPCCVYYGHILNADGTPTKRKQNYRTAFQCNENRITSPLEPPLAS